MSGWVNSGGSGLLTWMLSNVISTVWGTQHWINPRERKGKARRRRRGGNQECEKGKKGMKIKMTNIYVDDQEKALRFYTEVLGFVKKADFSQGPFRWLTVASADEPDVTELQLALNNNPAAKAFQQAQYQQNQPAAMFFTDDLQADYERMRARRSPCHQRK